MFIDRPTAKLRNGIGDDDDDGSEGGGDDDRVGGGGRDYNGNGSDAAVTDDDDDGGYVEHDKLCAFYYSIILGLSSLIEQFQTQQISFWQHESYAIGIIYSSNRLSDKLL